MAREVMILIQANPLKGPENRDFLGLKWQRWQRVPFGPKMKSKAQRKKNRYIGNFTYMGFTRCHFRAQKSLNSHGPPLPMALVMDLPQSRRGWFGTVPSVFTLFRSPPTLDRAKSITRAIEIAGVGPENQDDLEINRDIESTPPLHKRRIHLNCVGSFFLCACLAAQGSVWGEWAWGSGGGGGDQWLLIGHNHTLQYI